MGLLESPASLPDSGRGVAGREPGSESDIVVDGGRFERKGRGKFVVAKVWGGARGGENRRDCSWREKERGKMKAEVVLLYVAALRFLPLFNK
jgi:hypothetical protein